MPFPKSDFCIVCEAIRPEAAGKATILGFYGLAPNVELLTEKMGIPLPVCFMVGFLPIAITDPLIIYEHFFTFTSPNGTVLVQTPPSPINNAAPGARVIVAFQAVAVPFESGRHTLRVTVDKAIVLETSILIRLATNEELRRAGKPSIQ
jgi:hypothetical protein